MEASQALAARRVQLSPRVCGAALPSARVCASLLILQLQHTAADLSSLLLQTIASAKRRLRPKVRPQLQLHPQASRRLCEQCAHPARSQPADRLASRRSMRDPATRLLMAAGSTSRTALTQEAGLLRPRLYRIQQRLLHQIQQASVQALLHAILSIRKIRSRSTSSLASIWQTVRFLAEQ